MMKKRIISIVVLLAFLTAGFIYLNKVFSTSHYYINTSEDFKALAKKTNIDVIFYGSSHAYTAFNPLIFNKEDSIISFNLGSDALRVTVTDLVLEESLKYTKPKLVILEVYQHSLVFPVTESGKGYQLRALDFVSNFSSSKLKKVRSIYEPKEYLGVYFPLIRNHQNWNKYNYLNLSRRSVFDINENYYFNGFLGSNLIIEGENRERYKGFRRKIPSIDSTSSDIAQRAKDDITKFISIAKKAGSEVLIISSPDPRLKYWNYYFFDEMNELCEAWGVPYLNLNEYYDEMDLNINDFKDYSHLNTEGSIKASRFLAKYLKENYTFKDRSSEDIFPEQTKGYDALIASYKPFNPISYQEKVYQTLLDDLKITNLKVIKEQKNKLFFTINFKGKLKTPLSIENYRMAIHIYPRKNDLNSLNENSKSRNRNFEIHGFLFEKDTDVINLEFDSNIRDIEKLEMFLYDKQGYNGVKGQKVILDSISLSEI
ncbi:hypothetical protein [Aequorivita sp. KMM 9714]|uniref:hypothetical protein n=1 Tax=Aequorivita sp. KMM 9714 TaxID=2707173 RepID=UPI0013EAC376|nr:hypothetical protein [Aequorivita sp. KMM 9714]NGX83042.1 hypothetical protein [Aequorivita sp. KMM 9714]